MEIQNVLLVGVGGQGILLASEILAQAALNAGFQVKTNETHGMAQRGGSVAAQVRFGEEVHAPTLEEGRAQVMGALEKIEALRFAHFLEPRALAVVSTQQIIPVTVSSGQAVYPTDAEERLRKVFPRLHMLDAAGIATGLGNERVANLVILGAMSRGLDLPDHAWQKAIEDCVPTRHLEINQKAFAAGRQAHQDGTPVT